jgi:hypothetical protein
MVFKEKQTLMDKELLKYKDRIDLFKDYDAQEFMKKWQKL